MIPDLLWGQSLIFNGNKPKTIHLLIIKIKISGGNCPITSHVDLRLALPRQ